MELRRFARTHGGNTMKPSEKRTNSCSPRRWAKREGKNKTEEVRDRDGGLFDTAAGSKSRWEKWK